MTQNQPPLTLVDVARTEERRLALACSEVAREHQPFAGGVMCRGTPGDWSNSAFGVAIDHPVEPHDIDRLTAFYTEIGAEPRVEVTPFAHPSLLTRLAERRFTLRAFENVFYTPLDPAEPIGPAPPHPNVEIQTIDPDDQAAVGEWADLAARSFSPTPGEPAPGHRELWMRVARHERSTVLAAYLDRRLIATAAMELSSGAAFLFGMATHPDHRRKGIQQALIAWRLRQALAHGARLATISSSPGVATERNAQRAGFRLAYTKAALALPGEGLTPAQA